MDARTFDALTLSIGRRGLLAAGLGLRTSAALPGAVTAGETPPPVEGAEGAGLG